VSAGDQVSLGANATGVAPFTYQWSQLSGPTIELAGATTANTSFVAPSVSSSVNALFKVIATDKHGVDYQDTVYVSIGGENSVTIYEAETATLSGVTVESSGSGFSGTGYVTGFDNAGDSITWSVNVATTSYYDINIGYQLTSGTPKGFDFYIDGAQTSGTFTAASNDDTQFYSVSIGRHQLTAGTHTFVIKDGWRWYNVDNLKLTQVLPSPTPQTVSNVLVDGLATANAKALFAYIMSQYGHKTISGQQDIESFDVVEQYSGKQPAIYGWDLMEYSALTVKAMGAPSGANTMEQYIEKIKSGNYISTLTWHWHSPVGAYSEVNPCPAGSAHCWWNSFYSEHTTIDITKILANPEGEDYKALIADIDGIAVQLKKAQAENIPVLWRPLHEADGEWFWWGAKGNESFIKLWRLMHDRLTNHHQLHNLIWVWTNANFDWYPGDDVVDVIGIDAYPSDKHDLLKSIWNKMFERFDGHKVIALTEFGGVPFIDEMLASGVYWAYFASWNDRDTNNPNGPKKMNPSEVNQIYNSVNVVTKDELPPLL